MFQVLLPLKAVSPNKFSGVHWAERKRRVDKAREAVGWLMGHADPVLPCVVTLTRIAPSNGLDEHDNLPMSLKPVADAVAWWLGADDADKRIEWRYSQERGPYGVRVAVEAKA